MATAYIYARVSDSRQLKSDSIEHQITRCTAYHQAVLADEDVFLRGAEHEDIGVSALKTPFNQRAAGVRLIAMLKPGDHLIVDKQDRLTRNLGDFCNLCEYFQLNDITLHVVAMNLTTSSPIGVMVLQMLACFAGYEVEKNRVRQLESNAIRRKEGRATGLCPIGCKHVKRGKKKHAYREWDPVQRAVMQQIVRIRQSTPTPSFEQVSDEIERHLAFKAGRKFKRSAWYKRTWTSFKCQRAYCLELYYQHHCENAIDIPQEPYETALAFCKKNGYI